MLEPRNEEERLLFEWARSRLELERVRRHEQESLLHSAEIVYLHSETAERFRAWLEVAA